MGKKSPKHQYEWSHFHNLKSLYKDYLEHRLRHKDPHSTFKRYLVSRNARPYCDLFDDYRKGRTQFPDFWPDEMNMTFVFTTRISNQGAWGFRTDFTQIR